MFDNLEEIKENKVHKSMLKVLDGKRVLFLENDYGLFDTAGNFEKWLRENKVQYNALFNLSELDNLKYIKDMINYFDVIAFETTWTYEISQQIKAHVAQMKTKKIIVECYTSKPTWSFQPKGVIHDVYVLDSFSSDMDDWKFKKLRLTKGIWEK